MDKIKKELTFEIKDIDETTASFWAVASTAEIDRDGDSIAPDAWDLKNFKKNPVIPLFHNYHDFPVAKAEKIKVEDDKLMFKPQFAVDISPQARVAYELYKGGYMSAFSVGFIPKEYSEETRKDGRVGRNYTKVELLEISAVLVPSNQNALMQARSKGIDVDILDKEIEVKPEVKEMEQFKIDSDKKFSILKEEIAVEFAKLITEVNSVRFKTEELSKVLEAIIKPQTSDKELFSAEIKRVKQFTIK